MKLDDYINSLTKALRDKAVDCSGFNIDANLDEDGDVLKSNVSISVNLVMEEPND